MAQGLSHGKRQPPVCNTRNGTSFRAQESRHRNPTPKRHKSQPQALISHTHSRRSHQKPRALNKRPQSTELECTYLVYSFHDDVFRYEKRPAKQRFKKNEPEGPQGLHAILDDPGWAGNKQLLYYIRYSQPTRSGPGWERESSVLHLIL